MTLRTVEQQFETTKATALRNFQRRLEAIRTTGEASDYFIFETVSCLEGGLLLAALQLGTATLELRAREVLIQHRISASSDPRGSAFLVETGFEGRDFKFNGILDALKNGALISADERKALMDIYENIRIPLHHGIVGRYSRSRDDGSSAWMRDALFGNSQAHLTTGQGGMEEAIESYGVADLHHVIAALELLTSKYQKKRLATAPEKRVDGVNS